MIFSPSQGEQLRLPDIADNTARQARTIPPSTRGLSYMAQQTGMAYEKQSGTATTRDGMKLFYTVYGSQAPGRPRIALAHSLGTNGEVWEPVAGRLLARATVLTYDCRGHGASSKSPGPYRLEMFADDLADLLDHLGWESAHVAGASMGGGVALQFALSYPARTRSLGLIDTTAWYGAEAPKQWDWRAQEAQEKGLASLIPFQQTRWFTDAFREQHPDPVARCCAVFLANDVPSYAATCRMLGGFDLRPRLGELRMPTAVMVGEQDYAAPPQMARVLQNGISGATLLEIPNARHLTFIETPDIISESLMKLMERAGPES
jgi:3-oxoadipate enol-lactonase